MADMPSVSRRRALAAVGAATAGASGYVAGVRSADSVPDWLAGRDCTPAALVTNPMDWPFPQHDRANTGHAPERAGPQWPLTQRWEREWPVGNLHELKPLVVADGVVIALLTDSMNGVLLALSLTDGQTCWRRQVAQPRYGQVRIAGGIAFVEGDLPDSSTQFTARSLGDGSALWSGSIASHVPQTLADGRLLTVNRSPEQTRDDSHFAVTALDARTGVECWRAVHRGQPRDVAVADGRAIFPTHDDGILALDLATGEQQWRSDADGGSAAVTDGLVISSRIPGNLSAVSLRDGSAEWQTQSEHFVEGGESDDGQWHYARPGFEVGAVTSQAIVYTLDVYSDYPSRLQARDVETGDLLWDVGPNPTPVEYHGYSRPVMVGDDILVIRYSEGEGDTDPPDALLRLDVTNGSERDRITFSDDERVSPPVVADNTLLVPTDKRLIAYA